MAQCRHPDSGFTGVGKSDLDRPEPRGVADDSVFKVMPRACLALD